jgi:type IV pilus assembly protein PilE
MWDDISQYDINSDIPHAIQAPVLAELQRWNEQLGPGQGKSHSPTRLHMKFSNAQQYAVTGLPAESAILLTSATTPMFATRSRAIDQQPDSHPSARARRKFQGFTLIELLIVIVISAILAAVAMPAYTSMVNKSRAKDACADLSSLALNLENRYQLQLAYPVNAAGTVASTSTFTGWSPTQANYFGYTLVSTASSYTVTATGKGTLAGCVLTLDQANTRTASSSCGFSSW